MVLSGLCNASVVIYNCRAFVRSATHTFRCRTLPRFVLRLSELKADRDLSIEA